MHKAVILARGLGTRMRKANEQAAMTAEQARIAETGVKALIPIDRPFLDYVLHGLADAGYTDICLVIGPEHDQVRRYYGEELHPERIRIHFAVQREPLGTADAVHAAEIFAAGDPFLVINSDNYYPREALQGLRELDGAGLAGFEQEALVSGSNIPAGRITKFSVVRTNGAGNMVEIIEKPPQNVLDNLPKPICVSMNCWRFGPSIFEGCKKIERSARGEYELPDAVTHTMQHCGERYHMLEVRAPVLDLSSREDIAAVVEKLKGTPVEL